MSIAAYRAASRAAAPILERYLGRRLARGREDGARLPERMGVASRPRPDGPLVWLHAASVGEAVSVLSVMERLRRERPGATLLMTSGTVTSARVLADRLPDGVIHQYAPMDQVDWVRRFLDHWRPDLVLWVESEFWPAMLSEIGGRGLPALLINARLSPRSWRRWRRARWIIRRLLRCFQLCMAQSEPDAERLRDLGAWRVLNTGNLKLAAGPLPAPDAALAPLRAAIGDRPVWLAYSTHPGEERTVLDAHARIAERCPGLVTVIAPRHPGRGGEIEELVRRRGLVAARHSRGDPVADGTEILLADTIGELGVFFRLCKVALVGGSLTSNGGHNPIEPALLGCAILHGPHMENFREIESELHIAGAATRVRDADDIALEVAALITDDALRERFVAAAGQVAEGRHRVLDAVFGPIDEALDSILPPLGGVAAGDAGP